MRRVAVFNLIVALASPGCSRPDGSRPEPAEVRKPDPTPPAGTRKAEELVWARASVVRAIDFYSQDGWLVANGDDFVPIAIRDGLLIVGGCPNGDPVAVDVREQLGAAGYIGHETMWQAGSVREVFAVLAPCLGALAAGLDADAMPLDYSEATQRG